MRHGPDAQAPSKRGSAEPTCIPMDLTLVPCAVLPVLLLARRCRQDHADARRWPGLDRPAPAGDGRRQGRHRRAGAPRNVAMVYQQFINYPSLVADNIALAAAALARAGIDARVNELAGKLRRSLSATAAVATLRRPAAAVAMARARW